MRLRRLPRARSSTNPIRGFDNREQSTKKVEAATSRETEPARSTQNANGRPRVGIVSYPQDDLGMTLVRRFVEIFSGAGLRVVLLADSAVTEDSDSVKVKFPDRPGWARHLLFQVRIASVIARNAGKWDGVWFLVGGTVMLVPLLAARTVGLRTLLVLAGSLTEVSERTHGAKSFRTLTSTILESLTMAFSTHVLAYGKSGRQLRSARRLRSEVITEAHEFVDLSHFVSVTPFASRSNALGFIGRLSAEKGILRLLEALSYLNRDFPRLELRIVGDGPLRSEIETKIVSSTSAGNVRLLGWKTRAEMPSVYGDLRLLVIPSYTEGLPNVLLEAMACETPVLATAVGAIPEVIRDGYNGFLVESNDPRSLAAAIGDVLNREPNQIEDIVRRAKLDVTTSFGLESVVERYKAICLATGLLSQDL